MSELPPFNSLKLSAALRQDLRSDHAGETGAVAVYRGILCVTKSPAVARFAARHLQTEQEHLRLLDEWLPEANKSKLLVLWRWSGWLLGASAACFGPRWVYSTVASVERFVVGHYAAQVEVAPASVGKFLARLQGDEQAHLDDAARLGRGAGGLVRIISRVIHVGSALAVVAARRY